jgi:putative membrane protein
MVRNLQKGRYLKWYSPFFMRIWNEGATLLLFAIVFLVILKSAIHWIYGLGALIGLGLVLMLAIRAYKRYRARKQG